jgi:hypothetical protein
MKGILRVTPAQFDTLLEELATERRFPLTDLPSASIAMQLGIFLAFVGPANTYRSIAEIFGCNIYIISVSIHRVLRTLVSRYQDTATIPTSETPSCIRENPKRWPFFRDCIGAIDGSLIPISMSGVSDNKRSTWRCRKGYYAQNVFAAVDFNIDFRFVLAGWEGCAHDAAVLSSAKELGFATPEGCY